MKAKDFLIILMILIGMGVIMVFGKAVLIPFVLSLFIWYIIKDLRDKIANTKLGKKVPTWIENIFTFVLVFGSLFLITQVLRMNIANMLEQLPTYQETFNDMILSINELFKIDISALVKDFEFRGIINSLLDSLSGILSNAFMIILYVIFMLLEESSLRKRMHAMYEDKAKLERSLTLLGEVNSSVSNYISLKTIVSLVTATLSCIALVLLGVDYPVFWAMIIFLLNYIPTIGSLVATIFPTLMAFLQFNDIYVALYVLLAVGSIQIIVGNFVEPKVMGNSLNISPLVVILSLAVFGSLWGITGMILCVPFTVILIIIFSHFESTKSVAILLSDNGKLNKEEKVPEVEEVENIA